MAEVGRHHDGKGSGQPKNLSPQNHRESTNFYQHSEVYMKGGERQGKTSSPPIWLFQSSTLLNSLEEQYDGLYLTSVDGNYESK
eukprot:6364078-Ditylum_brightwellii.AAC.1